MVLLPVIRSFRVDRPSLHLGPSLQKRVLHISSRSQILASSFTFPRRSLCNPNRSGTSRRTMPHSPALGLQLGRAITCARRVGGLLHLLGVATNTVRWEVAAMRNRVPPVATNTTTPRTCHHFSPFLPLPICRPSLLRHREVAAMMLSERLSYHLRHPPLLHLRVLLQQVEDLATRRTAMRISMNPLTSTRNDESVFCPNVLIPTC